MAEAVTCRMDELHISSSSASLSKLSTPSALLSLQELKTPNATDRSTPTYMPSIVTPELTRLLNDARHCRLVLPPKADPMAPPTPPSDNTILCVSKTLPPRMKRQHWSLEDYTLVKKLYTGYASNVFKATCKKSGDPVVLKIYTLSAVCELYRYQIYREVKVHSSLRHENIIHLFAAFQEGEKVVMVQEYADGSDLFANLHKYGGRLSERLAVQLVLDPFLRVLQYLHSRGIIHRDIKPENILFTQSMCLKLGDFGLAIDLREERAVTRAGTLDYMAPEVLKCPFKSRPDENKEIDHLHYTASVDSWAVGVLTYELLIGFPPFFDQQSRNATEQRINTLTPAYPSSIGEEARDFISLSLTKTASERPTIHDMLHHPWIMSHCSRRSMRRLFPLPPLNNLPSPTQTGVVSGESQSPVACATAPVKTATANKFMLPSSITNMLSSLKVYPAKKAPVSERLSSSTASLLAKAGDASVCVQTSTPAAKWASPAVSSVKKQVAPLPLKS